MTRGDRRRRRVKKINHRLKLWSWMREQYYLGEGKELVAPGYFANNNEINKFATRGQSKKTNSRKGHQNYRSRGTYGKAVNWKPHDLKQINSMDDQINEML